MQCLEGVIQEDQVAAKCNELSYTYARSQKQVLCKYIAEFFNDFAIEDVDYAALNVFKAFLYDKDLKTSTIKVQFSGLKKYWDMPKSISSVTIPVGFISTDHTIVIRIQESVNKYINALKSSE